MNTYQVRYVNPFNCCDDVQIVEVDAEGYYTKDDVVNFYVMQDKYDQEYTHSFNGVLSVKKMPESQEKLSIKLNGFAASHLWMDDFKL